MSEKCTECGHYIEGERQWISNRCSECADTASATDALNTSITVNRHRKFQKRSPSNTTPEEITEIEAGYTKTELKQTDEERAEVDYQREKRRKAKVQHTVFPREN
jgi:predicted  nucleic acid-binding Zn-ribbon protein